MSRQSYDIPHHEQLALNDARKASKAAKASAVQASNARTLLVKALMSLSEDGRIALVDKLAKEDEMDGHLLRRLKRVCNEH